MLKQGWKDKATYGLKAKSQKISSEFIQTAAAFTSDELYCDNRAPLLRNFTEVDPLPSNRNKKSVYTNHPLSEAPHLLGSGG